MNTTFFDKFTKIKKMKCLPCSDSVKGIRIVDIENILHPPFLGSFDDIKLDERYKEILQIHNGMTLFYRKDHIDSFIQETGIRFFSYQMIIEKTLELQELLLYNFNISRSEIFPNSLEKWLKAIVVIGEPINSGNLYAINSLTQPDENYKVFLLDHENYSGHVLKPGTVKILANNLIEFIEKIADNPIPFLKSNWRYYEGYFSQWYPVEAF